MRPGLLERLRSSRSTPPRHVELEVDLHRAGVQGQHRRQGVQKNGDARRPSYEIQVPAFVNIGDVVKVDTRTGTYIERVKQGLTAPS